MNANDSGPGSLRDAMENTLTFPNTAPAILFKIPGDGPWHTIRLQSALPAMRWGIILDGESQTAFGGNTNAAGPEIELDGSALREGSGLRVCAGRVKGLVLDRGASMGRDRIHLVRREQRHQRQSPFGCLCRRRTAQDPEQHLGFTATRDADLGNGASGVAIMRGGGGTDVDDNFIGFNRHFGVGIAPNTQSIGMRGNSFQANWGLAIDRGFNGPSPAEERGLPGVPAIPEITNVRYENGETIIEGRAAFCVTTPTAKKTRSHRRPRSSAALLK